MKPLILYVSYSGNTRRIAEKTAEELGADIEEVREVKRRTKAGMFLHGCPQAMRREASEIQPIQKHLADYEDFILFSPIWAGYPVPAFNAVAAKLPTGGSVALRMVSAGGDSKKSAEGTKTMLEQMGLKVTEYLDIKS